MTPPPGVARHAAALGLPPVAAPADARAAFLRRLAADGFLPPEESVAAANALAGTAAPLTPDAAAAIREEVEAFAAGFWSLDPAARRSRWDDLVRRCSDPPARTRLDALRPALYVEAKPHPDPVTEQLAALVRGLFVLRPRERAVRRAGWLAERSANEEWAAAAKQLRVTDPGTAALEPVLLGYLGPGGMPLHPVEGIPGVEPPGSNTEFRLPARDEPTRATPGDAADRSSGPGGQALVTGDWRRLWWVPLVIAFFARAAGSCATGSRSPSGSQPPAYIPPSTPALPSRVFTPAEVESFRRYDPGSKELPPPGYQQWLLQGRPAGVPRGVPGVTYPSTRR